MNFNEEKMQPPKSTTGRKMSSEILDPENEGVPEVGKGEKAE